MSNMNFNYIKAISKSNFFWGILNCFIVLPLLVYVSGFVLYHDNKGVLELNDYRWQFFAEPMVFILILLVAVNMIVDFLVYKNPKKAILKKCLMFFNIIYILWFIINTLFSYSYLGGDNIFLCFLLVILTYKLFRYYKYYKLTCS